MSTSEQLEQEAEATRAEIAASLAELRERMTPGQVVDQAVAYVRDGRAGHFARNLGQQVVANPMPVALIGLGLGWLMMGTDRVTLGARVAVKRATRDSESDLRETARAAGEAIGAAAEEAYGTAADRTRELAGTIGRSAGAVGTNAASGGKNFAEFLRQEPLVLAGIGLALGAVVGAALKVSETEKAFMGKASDAVKEGVADAAEEKLDQAKAVAGAVMEKTPAAEKTTETPQPQGHREGAA
jgi:ElaB/YqjD/DUF883 family membrane-anchored ribosome-binding protein